jgi:transcriptional regulator with XRE-family HTH domain|tara:strand:+ start:915 stop:1232 length:318 start_codon:yes stop_codon:yes gene_type:complete
VNKTGLKFKLKRESLGLTQSDFSKALGITQGYLSDLENGVKIPSDTLLLLFEHIIKSQEEEMYKAKYIILAKEHMVALKQVLSLKEQFSSLEQVPEFSRKLRKNL